MWLFIYIQKYVNTQNRLTRGKGWDYIHTEICKHTKLANKREELGHTKQANKREELGSH
jgi:hypothetical protein